MGLQRHQLLPAGNDTRYWAYRLSCYGTLLGANYIQGGDAATYRALHGSAPPYLASSFTCVADMPHRRRLRPASTEQLDVPTCRRSTVGGRECLSCCWSKGVEWPAKRYYVGLVAVGVQEQAEDILVPTLLRNCLTLISFSFPSHYLPSRTVVLAIVFTV